MVITTLTAEDTIAQGAAFAAKLQAGDVVAYKGEMGAGKTTFTIGVAQGLGLDCWVSSPTFALVHEYQGKIPLCHFDMFRIQTEEDLYSTGFYDYLDGNRILVIEWSENILSALPNNVITVDFNITEGDSRTITITGDDRF